MARKKKKETPFTPLDEQVMDGDTITIAEVKQFIVDARKKNEDWRAMADRSWGEIKKRDKKGSLYGGRDFDKARRWSKFPLWWSCLKIRQPITLARLPIPVLKDTQGDDPFGRTACVVGERLTRGILKTFNAFDEFQSSTDDFLVTNFGWGRAFYRKEECAEPEKIRLQMIEQPIPEPIEGQPPPQPQPPIFMTPDGQQVDEYLTDEFGPYLLSGMSVEIENEEVYFESGLYSNLLVDPSARKWDKVTRLAFEYQYSYREFKEKFGQDSLDKLAIGDIEQHRTGKKPIIVYEYHDKVLKEVRWFAENSDDFFQPTEMRTTNALDGLTEVEEKAEIEAKEAENEVDNSDLYGLSGFFPCTAPLIINQSTDDFWPTPEFAQVYDIIEDVNSIVSRLILLTKAIRVKFLFDGSLPELKALINKDTEATGMSVANLASALMNANGNLKNLVAYFPIEEMIQGLQNMYTAFEQRLNMFYQITGVSDLLRGQTSNVEKTFGERQLEGKFALNRIEPFQRKVQEWIKDQYQLLMELALKMFSDQSLDSYITPQTLDPEDKQRYEASLELLRSNKRRRFRVDFETDSTVAINEQWKKQQATELANTLTKAMESTAKVAETQPELASAELAVLKHLIGEFSDGKLFIDEIQDAIQKVMDKVAQPKPPEPNGDIMRAQIEGQKLQLENQRFQFETQLEQAKLGIENQKLSAQAQLEQLKVQSTQQIELAKIQQGDRLASLESQLQQFKLNLEAQASAAEIQRDYQKISADIGLAREELALKRDELLVELRKIADKKEVDQFQGMIDARVFEFEQKLQTAEHELNQTKIMLDEQEKFATEARLQQEHELDKLQGIMEIALKKKELESETTIDVPKAKKPRKSKIVRDKNDKISEIIHED